MGTVPAKPTSYCSALLWSWAELVLPGESHGGTRWVGVPAWTVRPRAFYLCAGQRVLVHKAWTQTPQVQCAVSVPKKFRKRGVSKRRKGVHWAPGMGPPPFHGGSTALFRVVTELSTILKMSAPPFLSAQGLLLFTGQGQCLHRECLWSEIPRKPGSKLSSMTGRGPGAKSMGSGSEKILA